jgi:putative SOS response-associated peptidase YedK
MCGRFTLWISLEELAEVMPWLTIPGGLDSLTPRYNIAPTQPIAVVPNNGERALDFFVWGLIPSWAKDPAIGSRMINARGETVAEKPSFRAAYRRRRCLILADGFYEWQAVPGQKRKQPVYIHLKSGEPFAFAGLWERWQSEYGDEVLSATIITTTPNDLLAPIHNRMPVILPPAAYDRWLDPGEQPPGALDDLLAPYPASEMDTYPVSTTVNSPANDVPACIAPLG